MTHETTIKRIQSLVPSVLALEFGCEVIDLGHFFMGCADPHTMTLLSYDNQAEYDEPEDAVSSFLHYRGNPDVKIPSQNLFDDKKYKILGKPITLVTVLLAIEKKNKAMLELTVVEWGDILGFWNLSKDNFNDQSEEAKTFIGGLLGN